MKIGDLVKMEEPYYNNVDEWGIGIIVKFEERDPSVAVVHWSKLNQLSWDEVTLLEKFDEGR